MIAQTVTDWEVQIVDDCSTDNTAEVLKPYLEKYPNIHYYVLPQNGGPAVARSEAIKRATGKYIAFLDSDDLWMPDKLEKQIAFMESTGAKFSATGYGWMDEAGNNLHTVFIPPKKTDYKKCIRLSDPIGNLTVMYDQSALGKFEVPIIKKRNDFALWLQILKKLITAMAWTMCLAHTVLDAVGQSAKTSSSWSSIIGSSIIKSKGIMWFVVCTNLAAGLG